MYRLLVMLLFVSGCGVFKSDDDDDDSTDTAYCRTFVLRVCHVCDVSQSYEDTVCACLISGEVKNAQRYYASRDEADVACEATQLNVQPDYLTREESLNCRRDLDLLAENGRDACEYLGVSRDEQYSEYEYGYSYGYDAK